MLCRLLLPTRVRAKKTIIFRAKNEWRWFASRRVWSLCRRVYCWRGRQSSWAAPLGWRYFGCSQCAVAALVVLTGLQRPRHHMTLCSSELSLKTAPRLQQTSSRRLKSTTLALVRFLSGTDIGYGTARHRIAAELSQLVVGLWGFGHCWGTWPPCNQDCSMASWLKSVKGACCYLSRRRPL